MSTTPAIPVPQSAAPIDPATLAQWATSLLRSLPGAQPPANWAPGGSPLAAPSGFSPNVPGTPVPLGQVPGSNLLPSSPGTPLALLNRAAVALPHAQAGNGVPDNAFGALPGYEPRLASLTDGVAPHNAPAPSAPLLPAAPGDSLDALSQQAVDALATGAGAPVFAEVPRVAQQSHLVHIDRKSDGRERACHSFCNSSSSCRVRKGFPPQW